MVRRPAERGAAVFIVVLVITLLTAIGVFAARAATLQTQISGFNRQAMQALAVADLGAQSTLSYLAAVRPPNTSAEECRATAAVYRYKQANGTDAVPFCTKFYKNSLDQNLPFHVPTLARGSSANYGEGSLSSALLPTGTGTDPLGALDGNFRVELTDRGRAPALPGSDIGEGVGSSFFYLTAVLTSYGQIQPATTITSGACDPAALSASVRQTVRASIIYPGW